MGLTVWQIIIGVLMILVSIVIIAVVLLQQSRRSGVGAISGAADTFFYKNKARDIDSKMSSITKWVALVFFVLAIIASAIVIATK